MCQSSFYVLLCACFFATSYSNNEPINGQISISTSYYGVGASIDIISSFRLVRDSSDNRVYIEFYYNRDNINSVDIVFIAPYIFSCKETISVISNVEETTSTSIEIAALTL